MSTDTKFRISAHGYACLTSKFKKKNAELVSHLCLCCNEEENEKHVLLSCRKYINSRKMLFNKIEQNFEGFIDNQDGHKIEVIKKINWGDDSKLNDEIGHYLKETQKDKVKDKDKDL